jgi:RNA polymerase sigma-70 factor (ECF subfamily)
MRLRVKDAGERRMHVGAWFHAFVKERSPLRHDRPATRSSFVERLRDWGDDTAWGQFVSRYGKLVHRVAVRAGLRSDEADEVVQETALSVARKMPEFVYEPEKCSFEGWVRRIARLRSLDQLRRRGHEDPLEAQVGMDPGTATDDRPPAPRRIEPSEVPPHEAAWAELWREMVLKQALAHVEVSVSPAHYQIFFMNVVDGKPGRDVARTFGVSQATVYVIRHRLMKRLQREVDRLRQQTKSGDCLELDLMLRESALHTPVRHRRSGEGAEGVLAPGAFGSE